MGLLQSEAFLCLAQGYLAAFLQVHHTPYHRLHKNALSGFFLIIRKRLDHHNTAIDDYICIWTMVQ